MGRPLRITYPGAHYHVTSRGNEQKDIFKSRRDREQFLSYLESSVTRYIHLNPVRCGMVTKPEAHPWSSYPDYIGARPAPGWLCIDMVKERFGDGNKYREFVEDMLGMEFESPLRQIVASTLLGSESFLQEIMATHIDGKQLERDVPAIRELSKSRKVELIVENVRGLFGDTKLEQKVSIYLAHRKSGARLKELGAYFDKKDAAIAQTTRRLKDEMAGDLMVFRGQDI